MRKTTNLKKSCNRLGKYDCALSHANCYPEFLRFPGIFSTVFLHQVSRSFTDFPWIIVLIQQKWLWPCILFDSKLSGISKNVLTLDLPSVLNWPKSCVYSGIWPSLQKKPIETIVLWYCFSNLLWAWTYVFSKLNLLSNVSKENQPSYVCTFPMLSILKL